MLGKKSIAFPAISMGIYSDSNDPNFQKNAAQIALETITSFLENQINCEIEEVVFCIPNANSEIFNEFLNSSSQH